MKKTLIAIVFGLGAFMARAEQPVSPISDASAFNPASKAAIEAVRAASAPATAAPAKAPSVPKGQWNSIGEGIWYDDLFSSPYFQLTTPGQSWTIEVEQSADSPEWYRMLPYGPGSPVADVVGEDDSLNYVYLNTANPEKVWMPEFKAFGTFLFSHYVDENGWFDNFRYATLEDGIVSFPKESVAYRHPTDGWPRVTTNGKFRIALPGSKPADFTLTATAPYCVDEEGNLRIQLECGEDLADVKYVLLEGYYMASGNEAAIAQMGTSLVGRTLRANPKKRALFSLLVAGLDASGEVVSTAECWFFGPDELDSDTWKQAGTAVFTESFFAPVYSNLSAERLSVPYEESVENPGRVRLVNPYSVHSLAPALGHSHGHYIYIDASANEAVYVEASPVGLDFGGGEAAVWSWAGRYVDAGMASEAYNEGLFGTRKGNVITIPDNTLMIAEKKYANGSFTTSGRSFRVALNPDVSGIDAISAEKDSPERWYRLDGSQLPLAPSTPGCYIRRAGEKAEVIIK